MKQWPKPDLASLRNFYGKHELGLDGLPTESWQSRHLTQITPPYPMVLAWQTEQAIRKITCHREVSASLGNILHKILEHYGSNEEVTRHGLHLYGGCYNYRAIRGSANLSMHAWGAAIDIDPSGNPMTSKANTHFSMPMEVVKIFKDEGWAWGGDYHGRKDYMHLEAITR